MHVCAISVRSYGIHTHARSMNRLDSLEMLNECACVYIMHYKIHWNKMLELLVVKKKGGCFFLSLSCMFMHVWYGSVAWKWKWKFNEMHFCLHWKVKRSNWTMLCVSTVFLKKMGIRTFIIWIELNWIK